MRTIVMVDARDRLRLDVWGHVGNRGTIVVTAQRVFVAPTFRILRVGVKHNRVPCPTDSDARRAVGSQFAGSSFQLMFATCNLQWADACEVPCRIS